MGNANDLYGLGNDTVFEFSKLHHAFSSVPSVYWELMKESAIRVVFAKLGIEITIFIGNCESTFFMTTFSFRIALVALPSTLLCLRIMLTQFADTK